MIRLSYFNGPNVRSPIVGNSVLFSFPLLISHPMGSEYKEPLKKLFLVACLVIYCLT